MKPLSYKQLEQEKELEQLKGTCYNLQDKVCETMKELIKELDEKRIKKSSKKKNDKKGAEEAT